MILPLAVDAVDAIAEARKHEPDLIILDLGLPAGDGFLVVESNPLSRRNSYHRGLRSRTSRKPKARSQGGGEGFSSKTTRQ
jgi:DNA-binding NarL/FixJ family response regulator